MHFEVLVEGQSDQIALEIVLEKILGTDCLKHSWKIYPYRGLGRLPRNLKTGQDAAKRLLLDRLPQVLRGYGKSLDSSSAVIVVVDLDNRDCMTFKRELLDVLAACDPRPETLFRIAIEEGEAWLLGDRVAVEAAYPSARRAVLNGYAQDRICGTWELLADAVHPGGSLRLKGLGWRDTGKAKCDWARAIAPHMDVNRNRSKSFQVFRDGVKSLAGIA